MEKNNYNPNKISFVICVNDETYYEECLFYIEKLHVPEGFTLEVLPVWQAASIYQGYNQAMRQSDAKYKVYMHQDVFLVYPNILLRFLELFRQHPEIGMAGVLGTRSIPKNKYFYKAWDCGNVLGCNEKRAFHNELEKMGSRVIAIDGMFMMTQYDIPWREDVLNGWDFYDFSQSLEFSHRGYEIWVPVQDEPWCIHDCGYLKLSTYDERQKQFLRVYQEDFPDYAEQKEVYPTQYRKQFELMMELKEQFKVLLFQNQEKEVRSIMKKVSDERFFDTEFAILKNILEIIEEESVDGISQENGFLYDCGSFSQAYRKYLEVKFELRREKYVPDVKLFEKYRKISNVAKRIIMEHTMLKKITEE